jgi:hypothetical protein
MCFGLQDWSTPPGSGPLYEGLLTVGYHPAFRGTTVGPPLWGYDGFYEYVIVLRKRSAKGSTAGIHRSEDYSQIHSNSAEAPAHKHRIRARSKTCCRSCSGRQPVQLLVSVSSIKPYKHV